MADRTWAPGLSSEVCTTYERAAARALGVAQLSAGAEARGDLPDSVENHVMIGSSCAIADVRSDGSVTIHSATEYPFITSVISS